VSRRILVIDDDADVRLLLQELLARAGYHVSAHAGGREGLRAFHQHGADLVVLDVSMPDLGGMEVLERLRDLSDVPVLLVTALGAELERVRGLKAGADDYVVKPFGRQELLARIEAILRRAREPAVADSYSDGFLTVDFAGGSVEAGGRTVSLTPLELRLLGALVRHPGRVLSAEQLLEHAWREPTATSPERVKLYVSYLRRKLGEAGVPPAAIETVRGFGYRYVPLD
jgi:DNA-binding response OmpR family regulator